MNLLQPQDRRSRAPGDTREAVLARRRSLERGLGAPLLEALVQEIGLLRPAPRTVLDAGCGDGWFLAALCARFGLEGWGADISTPAIDAAARAHPEQRWVVANADRRLPFPDGAFDLALSITARQNVVELRRLLADGGRLFVVVPGPDDLAELRAAILGEAVSKDRGASTAERFAPAFDLEARSAVRASARLDAAALADLLDGSYRGVRRHARERLAAIEALDVTTSWELLRLRPRDR